MNNLFNLENKIALVTGTSGNLGPVWCSTLRDAGAKVFELDYPEYDVSVWPSVQKARDECLDKYGTPNIIIGNAALDFPPGSISTLFGDFRRIMEVNLEGNKNIVEAFAPDMVEWGGGNIVFIGSMLGFIASDPRIYSKGWDKAAAYGASKAALWNLVGTFNMRYAKNNLIFNMLALSAVEGKQSKEFKELYNSRIPIGRMLQKEDFITEFLTCCTARVPYDAPLFVGAGYTIY